MAEERAALNTDRELWREREGDYYANSIRVTEQGRIGVDVGGTMYVKTLSQWHALASGSNDIRSQLAAALEQIDTLTEAKRSTEEAYGEVMEQRNRARSELDSATIELLGLRNELRAAVEALEAYAPEWLALHDAKRIGGEVIQQSSGIWDTMQRLTEENERLREELRAAMDALRGAKSANVVMEATLSHSLENASYRATLKCVIEKIETIVAAYDAKHQELRRECSGPLPGRDVTAVQTGEKTLFITRPQEEPLRAALLAVRGTYCWCKYKHMDNAGEMGHSEACKQAQKLTGVEYGEKG